MRLIFELQLAHTFILLGCLALAGVSAESSQPRKNLEEEGALKYIRRKRNLNDAEPSPEFSSYFIVEPKVYHAREKREIDVKNLSPKKDEKPNSTIANNSINDLVITFTSGNQEYMVDLQLNHQLIPTNYFQKYHKKVSLCLNRIGCRLLLKLA